MDRARHADLGQGPGLESRRQHGQPSSSGTSPTRALATRAGPTSCSRPAISRRSSSRTTGHRAERRPDVDARRRGERAGHRRRRRTPTLTDARGRRLAGRRPLGDELLRLAGLDGCGGGLASDHGIGSNDWVVGPAMSATGGALLANDPHLGISMPSIWFINGLHCATVDDALPVRRGRRQLPRRPGRRPRPQRPHRVGRDQRRSRRPGPRHRDLDPADPTHYIGPDGTSLPFTVRTEQIAVSGGDPVTIEVRETIHGPILNDVDKRLADAPLMALRWSAIHPGGRARTERTRPSCGSTRAADFDDFRAALSLYGAPSQNFVYADVDGHIGYQLPGYMPVRSDPARSRRPRRSRARRRRGVGRPDPVRRPALGARPGRGLDRDGEQRRRSMPAYPRLHRRRNGIRATEPSGSSTSSTTTARTA